MSSCYKTKSCAAFCLHCLPHSVEAPSKSTTCTFDDDVQKKEQNAPRHFCGPPPRIPPRGTISRISRSLLLAYCRVPWCRRSAHTITTHRPKTPDLHSYETTAHFQLSDPIHRLPVSVLTSLVFPCSTARQVASNRSSRNSYILRERTCR